MKITLLGFMGSGKSTLGRVLAKKLKFNFVDLDDYIESKEHSSISEIFVKEEEAGFRDMEHDYLEEVIAKDGDYVIALGGGTPCFKRNWKHIKQTKSIYIMVGQSELYRRLHADRAKRPLIADLADSGLKTYISETMKTRRPFYKKANYTIHNNASSIAVSKRIIEKLNIN